jgi:hypothetical protein
VGGMKVLTREAAALRLPDLPFAARCMSRKAPPTTVATANRTVKHPIVANTLLFNLEAYKRERSDYELVSIECGTKLWPVQTI